MSCDMFLGIPFNIASYATLLEMFAAWSGRKAATLTMFLADVHIYVNHIDQVKEQLSRTPMLPPTLDLSWILTVTPEVENIHTLVDALYPEGIKLVDYTYHPAIKAPMAV